MTRRARAEERRGRLGSRIGLLVCATVVVGWTFAPAREFAFLNWDDEAVIVRNAALDDPGVVRWAFTTTDMEHYQPISWLAWSAIKRAAGPSPTAFHAANIVGHVVCALLVFVLTIDLTQRVARGMPRGRHDAIALAATLLYALHPLRVEVVAWISALPYTLALALALLSALAWLRTADAGRVWWWSSLGLYAASLAARPVALGLPLVLAVLDALVLARRPRESVMRLWPFALITGMATVMESAARAPGVNEVSWLFRLQSAAIAPLVYVWHTLAPLRLTPLDLLPADPVASPPVLVAALATLAIVVAVAWAGRHRRPWLAAVVVAYLALLAPAAGLISSGQQLTADRYTYLPGVVLAIAVAGAGARWARTRRRAWIAAAVAGVLSAASAAATRDALRPWSDSVALWSRVVRLDPANDLGLYNLAEALAAAGRSDEASARYREVLMLAPGHVAARANLDRLDAVRFENDGHAAAARGDLAPAAESYRRATGLDVRRAGAHAGLGMALARLGRPAEAMASLRAAIHYGIADPMVPNTLAGLLIATGQGGDARAVLEAAVSAHPGDINLTHNLARVLATSPGLASADAARALRLAALVVEATGERDPRALDTLAAALAANGRIREAADASDRGAALAAAQGDRDLAAQIAARRRAFK